MCEIRRRREVDGTSLGVFKPAELREFVVEEDRSPWEPAKQIRVDQPSMLMPGKTALEKLPYRFLYSYRCADATCKGHRQSIIDWEIGAAFREWRDERGNEETAYPAGPGTVVERDGDANHSVIVLESADPPDV